MAVKKRVFQVAREFNISNEALIEFLKGHGYDIRNHMSPITGDAYAQVMSKYGEQPVTSQDANVDFRKKLRDRQEKEKADSQKAKEDLERRLWVASQLAEEKPKRRQQKPAEETAPQRAKSQPEEAKPAKEAARETTPAPHAKAREEVKRPERKRQRRRLKIVEIPPESPEKEIKEAPSKTREKVEAKTEKAEREVKPKEKEEKAQKAKKERPKKKKKPEAAPQPKKTKKKKRRRKKAKPVFNEEEIQANIRQTLASMEDTGKGKRKKRKTEAAEVEATEEKPVIRVSEFMSLAELARLMEVDSTELIRKCMDLGMMVTINQRLDMETIQLLASEYDYKVEALSEFAEDMLEDLAEEDVDEGTIPRPPIVTIMGHVDHGKTSLLDHIRKSNIIAGESGGITQHIGAYEVSVDSKEISFLDTPGHEAFTAMRARGAQATDIVVLVVAADDSVMPQTIEAISHSKAAGVPIIVAINKIDKPSANPDMIRQQLAEHDVLVEEWGGKYQSVELSAKTGENIDQLLEKILLEAEMLDLRANPDRKAKGVVIEARKDKGKGVVSTVLVQTGSLHIGDPFIAGAYSGKVRNMLDERGKPVNGAGPSRPVQILGFDGVPQAGDKFIVLSSERDTREISQKRQQLQREHEHWKSRPRTLDEISRQIQKGQIKQLSVIIKADVDGSIEAIADSLQKLATEEVAVNIIHRGVGAITESDVLLASASGGVIIGFHVRPTVKARELAKRESVDIRSYNVIYDIIEDVKSALEGFLEPHIRENVVGTTEVRDTFKVPKAGIIAGCYVLSGRVNRNDKVKIYRDDKLIHEGTISSLKRFKEDVKEVSSGYECGMGIEKFNDIKVNDIIEAYELIEEKRFL